MHRDLGNLAWAESRLRSKARHTVGLVVHWPTGGIRTHLQYLFREIGHRFRPILVARDSEETRLLCQGLERYGVEHVAARGASILDLTRAAWRAVSRFDIHVVHSHGFGSTVAATPVCLSRQLPHLCTTHDVVTEGIVRREGWTRTSTLGIAVRLADAVHAVSPSAAVSLRLLPFAGGQRNIHVINNGIDVSQFTDRAPVDIRAEHGIPSDTKLVGFFGRFMGQKGFRVLIDAAAVLIERGAPRFVVVTHGDGGFVREDTEYLTSKGLRDHFVFRGLQADPGPSIAAMDVVAMPSRWEAFGLLAAEVLCSGVPLIATDCEALLEITRGSPARIVRAGSADALADALQAELANGTQALAMDYAATARARFSFRANAEQLADLLDFLVAARRRT